MKKNILSLATMAAIASGAFANGALAERGVVNITNDFDTTIVLTVRNDGWNCLDEPLQGHTLAIASSDAEPFQYSRKFGHGCDGEQGVAVIEFQAQNNVYHFNLSVDGNGCMRDPIKIDRNLPFGTHFSGDCGAYDLTLIPFAN